MRAAVDIDRRPSGGGWSDEQIGEDDVAAEVAGDGPRVDDSVEGAHDDEARDGELRCCQPWQHQRAGAQVGEAGGENAASLIVQGHVSELVAQGAERIVAIVGVPALVMGMVVTPAATPNARNQIPGHDSMLTALDQSEHGPHDATHAQGEQQDKGHSDLVRYRRPQSQLG